MMLKKASCSLVAALSVALFVILAHSMATRTVTYFRPRVQSHALDPVDEMQHDEDHRQCLSLVVRTQLGLQSKSQNTCKTPRIPVDEVCVPMCGSESFVVDVADNADDDRVASLKVKKCTFRRKMKTSSKILVVFRMTRVFNGYHMYHVLNNFVVNLDPNLLEQYVFHCWGDNGCPVEFSDFFDKPLNLNARRVNSGCYNQYIVLGEHYTTYNVERNDVEKIKRWRSWADIFKRYWCPSELIDFDERFFTHLDRRDAQNGRNMHGCQLASHSSTRYVQPSIQTMAEDAHIFCNTRLLFSAEGNGLTNMILLPPQSTVVVLWQMHRHVSALQSIYGNMAKLLGMNLVPIPVESDADMNVNCSSELNLLLQALY